MNGTRMYFFAQEILYNLFIEITRFHCNNRLYFSLLDGKDLSCLAATAHRRMESSHMRATRSIPHKSDRIRIGSDSHRARVVTGHSAMVSIRIDL